MFGCKDNVILFFIWLKSLCEIESFYSLFGLIVYIELSRSIHCFVGEYCSILCTHLTQTLYHTIWSAHRLTPSDSNEWLHRDTDFDKINIPNYVRNDKIKWPTADQIGFCITTSYPKIIQPHIQNRSYLEHTNKRVILSHINHTNYSSNSSVDPVLAPLIL